MKIILSPSKKMEIKSDSKKIDINFENKTMKILEKLQRIDFEELNKVLKIKGEIGERTYNIYKDWEILKVGKAGFIYKGSTYDGLDIETWEKEDLEYARDKIFIMSAFYGVLEIDSMIREYRLDMNARLKIEGKNLYTFWRTEIDNFFQKRLEGDVLINLASDEFSKILNLKKYRIIKPIFKEKKGDEYKTVSVFSKKARGSMARYIIKNKIEKVEDLKKYSENSYIYSEDLSNENDYVFIR